MQTSPGLGIKSFDSILGYGPWAYVLKLTQFPNHIRYVFIQEAHALSNLMLNQGLKVQGLMIKFLKIFVRLFYRRNFKSEI